MDTKYLKRVAIYLLSAAFAVAVIVYICYHLADGFTTDISTIYATPSSEQISISGDGYIFKDEDCIFSSYSSAINYLVSDGEKVSVNSPVAECYSDSAGYDIGTELREVEEKLSVLRESSIGKNAAVSDTSAIDKKISSYYRLILENLSSGKYSHAMQSSAELLVQMNKRQLITGEVDDFSALEASLESQKKALTSRLSGKSEIVCTEKSGYFHTSADGYEGLFSASVVDKLTLSSFFELTESEPENFGGRTPIGKISYGYKWYIALPTDKESISKISVGKKYSAVFPYNYDTEITLCVERILTELGDARAVIIFSTGEMPEGFNYKRMQSLEIIISESIGYRVPTTAVRVVDGHFGVYTLYGGKVIFKRADIIGRSEGYYILSTEDTQKDTASEESTSETSAPESEDTESTENKKVYSYLARHDKIIVSGKELSDGMVFY